MLNPVEASQLIEDLGNIELHARCIMREAIPGSHSDVAAKHIIELVQQWLELSEKDLVTYGE